MRQYIKQQIISFLGTLQEVHPYIIRCNEQDRTGILEQCQDGAMEAGQTIEQSEGEDCPVVHKLEKYCEALYQININAGTEADIRKSTDHLSELIASVIQDIDALPTKRVALFLPYKASMWDSLESIYLAARQDPECEAYVIPIPYFDKNPDGTIGQMHCEADEFPEDIPVTDWQTVDVEKTHPEMIFIHNPYDQYNHVTTVYPKFYSQELKKNTDTLVYVPYYSTAGGMSEAQESLSAYYVVDYIITQGQRFRQFFDKDIPDEKFLPLGSPKFDRIIRMCANPPAPPEEWEKALKGKKAYFYNTSLAGFLGTSAVFFKKMKYVFDSFKGRDDAVIIWRPHPLLESTLKSMRPMLVPEYQKIRQYFIDEKIGILDETPDVTKTIALSYAYIGDSGTSITSLFGMTGKPMFILNNWYCEKPGPEDWKGSIVNFGSYDMKESITQSNCLFVSDKGIYDRNENGALNHLIKRRFIMNLSEYAEQGYYTGIVKQPGDNRMFLTPGIAEDFLIYENGRISKVSLKHEINQGCAFAGALRYYRYLVLIPYSYPALVRYDIQSGKIEYFDTYKEVYARNLGDGTRFGGACLLNGILYLGSPFSSQVVSFDIENGAMKLYTTGTDNGCGSMAVVCDDENLYFLPDQGTEIIRWNPATKETRQYNSWPEDFQCINVQTATECAQRPFSSAAIYDGKLVLAPFQANMFISLNTESGKAIKWDPPVSLPDQVRNGYFSAGCRAWFSKIFNPVIPIYEQTFCGAEWVLCSCFDNRFYRINLKTQDVQEVQIDFDIQELQANEPGFARQCGGLQYCCYEDVFNSLADFLDGNISGAQFNKEEQIRYFEEIACNSDGTCGEKTYQAVKKITCSK